MCVCLFFRCFFKMPWLLNVVDVLLLMLFVSIDSLEVK